MTGFSLLAIAVVIARRLQRDASNVLSVASITVALQVSLGGQHHTSKLVAEKDGVAAWHQHFTFVAVAPCV